MLRQHESAFKSSVARGHIVKQEGEREMKVTKQETVMFSKGRCCFVRFEGDGTSDRALLKEDDAVELVRAWESRDHIIALEASNAELVRKISKLEAQSPVILRGQVLEAPDKA